MVYTMPHAPYARIHAAAAGMTAWRHGPDQEAAIGGGSQDAASGHAAWSGHWHDVPGVQNEKGYRTAIL